MLIDVEQFKGIYGRIVGSMRYEEIAALIDGADGLMARYCGYRPNTAGARTLAASDYDLYYDGPGRALPGTLWLGARPVVSVATVTVSGTVLTVNTDYTVDLERGRLGLVSTGALGSWPVGFQAIEVTFTAGYDPTPADLIPLTASVVQAMLDRPNLQGQQAASLGGVSVTTSDLDNFLPAAVRAALDAGYKLAGCC